VKECGSYNTVAGKEVCIPPQPKSEKKRPKTRCPVRAYRDLVLSASGTPADTLNECDV